MAYASTNLGSFQIENESNSSDKSKDYQFQSINYGTIGSQDQQSQSQPQPQQQQSSNKSQTNSITSSNPQAINPHTVSNTASHQHKQEQELLSSYTVPNPPISTKQSNAIITEQQHQQHQQHDSLSSTSSTSDQPRTLWMGDLDSWLDEQQITDLWWNILQKKVIVKIIKPKSLKIGFQGLTNSGYCFVEFESFEDAQQALSLNGQLLPDIAMPSQQHFLNNPDNQKKYFRLNWASGATLTAPIIQMPEFSLFVGDLSASTTEAHLLAFFQKSFPDSIKTVRVMTDPISGKSRCFGFVRFTDESERQRALTEMNGIWFAGRPLRVALATPRNTNNRRYNQQSQPSLQQQQQQLHHSPFIQHPNEFQDSNTLPPEMMFLPPQGSPLYGFYNQLNSAGSPRDIDTNYLDTPQQHQNFPRSLQLGIPPHQQQPNQISPQQQQQQQQQQPPPQIPLHYQNQPPPQQHPQQFADPNNTTVFVGGLSSEVTEATLFTLFKPFGIIQQIKIPPGKNCGFVKYSTREEAEETIAAMQGFIIGGNRVRLSWGRVSMNNKRFLHQQQPPPHQTPHLQQLHQSYHQLPPQVLAAPGGPQLNIPPPPIHPLGVPIHSFQYQPFQNHLPQHQHLQQQQPPNIQQEQFDPDEPDPLLISSSDEEEEIPEDSAKPPIDTGSESSFENSGV
ncbi:NGR1 [Candida pseudojiufengensis]|uniref:NGR1 n=1 Tax=Candida pseudojiufengensis TaxID=497109 RepID=UPI0022254C16|nr:NGR1 [Candida pseudojiufengensis]KAI5961616.1 NGR1 [Candida pseudojiufengensis]